MNRQEKYWLVCCIAVFSVVAVVGRLIPHEYNFVAFGGLALFCGCYLRGWTAWTVPLGTYLISEVLGRFNGLPPMSIGLLFWVLVGYASQVAVGLFGGRFLQKTPTGWRPNLEKLGLVATAAILGSCCFFAITNFASWLDPRMGYAPTRAGLLNAFIQGIPFHRWTLASDMAFSLLFFSAHQWLAVPQSRIRAEQS